MCEEKEKENEAKRLNTAQQNYLDGIDKLVRFYYQISSQDEDNWFSDKNIMLISKIFSRTIPKFTQSVCYRDGIGYKLRYSSKDTCININNNEFRKFIEIMGDFHKECLNERIHDVYKVTKTICSVDSLPVLNRDFKAIQKNFYYPVKLIRNKYDCKIFHDGISILVDSYRSYPNNELLDLIESGLDDPPSLQETFYVEIPVNSDLVYSLSSIDEHLAMEQDGVVSSPKTSEETKFSDAIRYIFAKYYTLFGSFDRIKICKYEKCRRLVVERKLGATDYCKKRSCRVLVHKIKQPKEALQCRERNNNWFRSIVNKINENIKKENKKTAKSRSIIRDEIKSNQGIAVKNEYGELVNVKYVSIKDCNQCNLYKTMRIKGGQCEIFTKNNDVVMKEIEEFKAKETKKREDKKKEKTKKTRNKDKRIKRSLPRKSK